MWPSHSSCPSTARPLSCGASASQNSAWTGCGRLLRDAGANQTKETQAWLKLHPQRFEFVFTPTHGSWLNIVETMFSKMARSMLRGIRVASKQELVDRIHLYFEQINADPVIFRWKYKMDEISIG